jgi:hypothetical protein
MHWIYNHLNSTKNEVKIIVFMLLNNKNHTDLLADKLNLFNDSFEFVSLALITEISEIQEFKDKYRCVLIDFSKEFKTLTINNCFLSNSVSISNKYEQKIGDCEINSNIGFQRNIGTNKEGLLNEYLDLNSFSLGELNEKLIQCEPVLRQVQQIFIDLNCLKLSETLDTEISLPTGLTIEQLCRILRFSCGSNHLSVVYFNFNNFKKHHTNNFTVTAILMWYLCEALEDFEKIKLNESEITYFVVESKQTKNNLIFSFDKNTDQWNVRYTNSDHSLPCIYSDYQSVFNGEIPVRIARLLIE